MSKLDIKQDATAGSGFVNEDGGFLDNLTYLETGSTSTNLKPYGVTEITSTGAAAFTLGAPIKNARKTIIKTNASTAAATVTVGTTANGISVGGLDSARTLTFNGQNDSIELIGKSTTKWLVKSINSVTLS